MPPRGIPAAVNRRLRPALPAGRL